MDVAWSVLTWMGCKSDGDFTILLSLCGSLSQSHFRKQKQNEQANNNYNKTQTINTWASSLLKNKNLVDSPGTAHRDLLKPSVALELLKSVA